METAPRHSAYSRISNNITHSRLYRLSSKTLLLIYDELSDLSTLALRMVCSRFIYLFKYPLAKTDKARSEHLCSFQEMLDWEGIRQEYLLSDKVDG